MVFIRENDVTRIALPMKHRGTAGDWGSDIGTASMYVNGERVFPKQTNLNDATLIGTFHEEFWTGGSTRQMLEMSKLPRLYCTSRPGVVPGGSGAYHMKGWGFATKGSSSSTYYKWETGINVASPIDYYVYEYNNPAFQRRYLYVNSNYAQWNHNMSSTAKNFYQNRLPSGVSSETATHKCAINYLIFNRTDQYQYFLARPYALLLFKDWTDANIASYFSASGFNDGNTTRRFGINFLTADTWQTPLDWSDIYIGAYVFDSTQKWHKNFGYPAKYHVVDKYTYGGHTYHIVTAGVAEKTVPASVASSAHTEACSPFGVISTPVFNIDYSNNVIQWSELPAAYGYTYDAYILEYGAEYYVGHWQ